MYRLLTDIPSEMDGDISIVNKVFSLSGAEGTFPLKNNNIPKVRSMDDIQNKLLDLVQSIQFL